MISNKKKPAHGRKVVSKSQVKAGASAMSQAMSQKVGSTKKHKGQINRIEKKI